MEILIVVLLAVLIVICAALLVAFVKINRAQGTLWKI